MLRGCVAVVLTALVLGSALGQGGAKEKKAPSLGDDLATLASNNGTWRLVAKKGAPREVRIQFVRDVTGNDHQLSFMELEKGSPRAAVVAKLRMEEKGKQRSLVATVGETNKQVVRIPYTLKGGALEIEKARLEVEGVVTFDLKGKWERVTAK